MKKIILIALCTCIFGACSYQTQPKYTKVESILKLTPGLDKSAVSTTLGIEPYDIYTIQKDGSTILIYHYKHKQRELNSANDLNEKGLTEEKTSPRYLKAARLFVLFDKDGKMSSVWTEEGTENALRIIQIDHQARRYLSSTGNTTAINDSILFSYAGHFIKKEETPKLKKKGTFGKAFAIIFLGAIAAFGATTL